MDSLIEIIERKVLTEKNKALELEQKITEINNFQQVINVISENNSFVFDIDRDKIEELIGEIYADEPEEYELFFKTFEYMYKGKQILESTIQYQNFISNTVSLIKKGYEKVVESNLVSNISLKEINDTIQLLETLSFTLNSGESIHTVDVGFVFELIDSSELPDEEKITVYQEFCIELTNSYQKELVKVRKLKKELSEKTKDIAVPSDESVTDLEDVEIIDEQKDDDFDFTHFFDKPNLDLLPFEYQNMFNDMERIVKKHYDDLKDKEEVKNMLLCCLNVIEDNEKTPDKILAKINEMFPNSEYQRDLLVYLIKDGCDFVAAYLEDMSNYVDGEEKLNVLREEVISYMQSCSLYVDEFKKTTSGKYKSGEEIEESVPEFNRRRNDLVFVKSLAGNNLFLSSLKTFSKHTQNYPVILDIFKKLENGELNSDSLLSVKKLNSINKKNEGYYQISIRKSGEILASRIVFKPVDKTNCLLIVGIYPRRDEPAKIISDKPLLKQAVDEYYDVLSEGGEKALELLKDNQDEYEMVIHQLGGGGVPQIGGNVSQIEEDNLIVEDNISKKGGVKKP